MKKCWVVFCEEEVLLQKCGDSYILPFIADKYERFFETLDSILRYEFEGVVYSSVVVPVAIDFGDAYSWVGLRESYEVLPLEHYTMVAKSRQLQYWNQNSKYCGSCGREMSFHTEISKVCEGCGKEIWPVLQPAIIVLVTKNKGEEVLLVQSRNFRGDYYGLVAGYVETGETLEECVYREVLEETGCSVKNIRYIESQSWPHPNTLMIGFHAEYSEGELRLQDSELKRGGWFPKSKLPEIPKRVSLARRLIDRWILGEI